MRVPPIYSGFPRRPIGGIMMTVRLIKHENVPDSGSFEVRFDDGRPSKYFYWDFYWDDEPSRRLRSEQLGRGGALKQALRDKGG